jgi:ribosomal protein S18 acetylase RimI-like enzyme
MSEILASPARPSELTAAFQLVFQSVEPEERSARVANALRLVQQRELDPAGVWVVRGRGCLRGAMVCLPVPGASGLVWPPQAVVGSDRRRIEDELLCRACAWLRQRGAKLAQSLLSPQEAELAPPLVRNGFAHVTGLWYLRHDLHLPYELLAEKGRLTFRPYSGTDPALFHQTLLRTYEQTRDCPEINGVRTVDEVIHGHQAQGSHNPDRWWLALHGERPIGVLLMTAIPEWRGWDVSYLGVLPEVRRRGFGRELTRKALLEAMTASAQQVTLAVDSRNQPAWDMYRAVGFEPYDRREVYLALWGPRQEHP